MALAVVERAPAHDREIGLAQKLMYAHHIGEHEVEDAPERGRSPIEDTVVDVTGHHVRGTSTSRLGLLRA